MLTELLIGFTLSVGYQSVLEPPLADIEFRITQAEFVNHYCGRLAPHNFNPIYYRFVLGLGSPYYKSRLDNFVALQKAGQRALLELSWGARHKDAEISSSCYLLLEQLICPFYKRCWSCGQWIRRETEHERTDGTKYRAATRWCPLCSNWADQP